MVEKTALYRHFDENGVLLYIGISCNPFERTSSHERSAWFYEIASITIKYFSTRSLALKAEKDSIKNENPRYNSQHVNIPHLFDEEMPKTFNTDDWLVVSDFADRVGRKPSWITHYLHNGTLRRMRFGNQWFIHISMLDCWPPPKKKMGKIKTKF